MDFVNEASKLVMEAHDNPRQWFRIEQYDDEVLFANGVWSVGSNADVEDFDQADRAVEALAWSWREQARAQGENA